MHTFGRGKDDEVPSAQMKAVGNDDGAGGPYGSPPAAFAAAGSLADRRGAEEEQR
ncbi:hypothetical protein M8494_29395 [Serratia ureilytica]